MASRTSLTVVFFAATACFAEPTGGADGDGGTGTGSTSAASTSTGAAESSDTGNTTPPGDGSTAAEATSASSDTSVDDTTGAGVACEDNFQCVPPIPAGWSGPHAVTRSPDGGAPSPCPPGMGEGMTLIESAVADDATCQCSCSELVASGCVGGNFPIALGVAAGLCPPASGAGTVGPGCMNTATDWMWAGVPGAVTQPVFDPGTCAPLENPIVPPPTITAQLRVCSPFLTEDGCDGGALCSPPPPPMGQLCIVQEGEQECPPPYPNANTGYADLADDRGCTACQCTEPFGACEGQVVLYDEAGCVGLASAIGAGQCAAPGVIHSLQLVGNPTITMACEPNNPTPTGGIELRTPFTICCQ